MSVELTHPWTVSVAAAVPLDAVDEPETRRPRTMTIHRYEIAHGTEWLRRRDGESVAFWAAGPMTKRAAQESAARISRSRTLDTRISPDPTTSLIWHPYWYSVTDGIPNDPLELDPYSGPHGRKGVSRDVLDPRVFGESEGTYVFWTAVTPSSEVIRVQTGSRLAYEVWSGGEVVASAEALPPARIAPWGLEDRRYPLFIATVPRASRDVVPIAMVLDWTGDQTPRAFIDLFGEDHTPSSTLGPDARRSGALRGQMRLQPDVAGAEVEDERALVRFDIPIMASLVTVKSDLAVASVHCDPDGAPIGIVGESAGEVSFTPPASATRAVVSFTSSPYATGGKRPIVNITTELREVATHQLRPWAEWGLGELSGRLAYRCKMHRSADNGRPVVLDVNGLNGSASIKVDGVEQAVVYSRSAHVPLPAADIPGIHVIEVEIANSLGNVFAVRPGAYHSVGAESEGVASLVLHGGTIIDPL